MLKLLKNLKKIDLFMMAISIVLICGQVYLDLEIPSFMSNITTLVMTSGTTGKILLEGLKMLGCALGSAVMAVVVGYFAAKISASFSMNLREKIFNNVQKFSVAEIKGFSTASLITRTTNDVTQVQMTIAMGMQVLIKAPIMAIWAIVKILGKSWQWSFATAVAVLFLLILVVVIMVFAIPKFKRIQTQTDDLNRVSRENLLGTRVVRAYNAEEYEENRFKKVNDSLTKTHLNVSRIMAIMSPAMSFIMSGLSLAIYWIGAFLINRASIFSGERIIIFSDMVVFSQYAIQVVMSFIMVCMIFIILPRATVSAKRINEVLDTKSSIKDGTKSGDGSVKGTVQFKNVSFKYPDADEYVLKNISFEVGEGETIAFIGSTGSGKSTLINLIPRFYDCTEGEILIDGINIKNYKISELNKKIGYVSQKAILFTGTVSSNLKLGTAKIGEINHDQIKKAVKIAQGAEFIEKMQNTYDAQITQGGNNLSGGQKQRLSIARAIARDPEIFIFDDSFSALDYKTDLILRKELMSECKNATKLIVAQRIGTIKDADKIVVLSDGEIVGMGKHNDLLKNCEIYKEIALSQLNKEELN